WLNGTAVSPPAPGSAQRSADRACYGGVEREVFHTDLLLEREVADDADQFGQHYSGEESREQAEAGQAGCSHRAASFSSAIRGTPIVATAATSGWQAAVHPRCRCAHTTTQLSWLPKRASVVSRVWAIAAHLLGRVLRSDRHAK